MMAPARELHIADILAIESSWLPWRSNNPFEVALIQCCFRVAVWYFNRLKCEMTSSCPSCDQAALPAAC